MNIREAYCLNPKKIIKKSEGYELHLSKVRLALTPVNYKESEILSSAEIVSYLINRGFTNIVIIRKSKEGKPFIKEGSRIYILTDDIDAPKFKLDSRESAMIMTEILANFHKYGEGFVQPPGVKVKVSWGRKLEKYRSLTTKLERYMNYIKKAEDLSPFEEYTREYLDALLSQAKASVKVLKSMDYLKALEISMKRREIGLNTVSNNTAKIVEGKVVITKIFDMGYNMAEEDIACLVKRMIGDSGSKTFLDDILTAYERIRSLGPSSRDIIKALVSFPADSLKVIAKYMENRERGEELLEKFKEYVSRDLRTDIMGV